MGFSPLDAGVEAYEGPPAALEGDEGSIMAWRLEELTSRMACFQSLRARLPRILVGNHEDSPVAGTGMKGVKVKLVRVSIVPKD